MIITGTDPDFIPPIFWRNSVWITCPSCGRKSTTDRYIHHKRSCKAYYLIPKPNNLKLLIKYYTRGKSLSKKVVRNMILTATNQGMKDALYMTQNTAPLFIDETNTLVCYVRDHLLGIHLDSRQNPITQNVVVFVDPHPLPRALCVGF
jgi:hypothetical protein